MRMHNGNFPQWMEQLSYLVRTMATNELAMWGARASANTKLPFSPDIFQSQQQKAFSKIIFCSTFKVNANAV